MADEHARRILRKPASGHSSLHYEMSANPLSSVVMIVVGDGLGRHGRRGARFPRAVSGFPARHYRIHGELIPSVRYSRAWHCILRSLAGLTRVSHHLTVEARHRPAITALRLLAVLNVLFKYARIIQEMRRRASRALY